MISIIFPVGRSLDSYVFQSLINNIKNFKNIELLIITTDNIQVPSNIKNFHNIFVYDIQTESRAERINYGVSFSKGSMILLHHPRSTLTNKAFKYLINNKDQIIWGGFTHKFDSEHPFFVLSSWYSNTIRAKKRNIVYLDHCIFFHSSLWKTPLPKIDIFEDTILSKRLGCTLSPLIVNDISTTSAVRFLENGMLKQWLMNQLLKTGYYLGVSEKKMNQVYEKKLKLNSKY